MRTFIIACLIVLLAVAGGILYWMLPTECTLVQFQSGTQTMTYSTTFEPNSHQFGPGVEGYGCDRLWYKLGDDYVRIYAKGAVIIIPREHLGRIER